METAIRLDEEQGRLIAQRELGRYRLIVVSNREPYIHQAGRGASGETICLKPAGGLVSALDPLMRCLGGTWIAWGSGNRDLDFVDKKGKLRVPPEAPSYELKRVWLEKDEVEGYYYGYANRALWPLCHILVERTRFRRSYWRNYQRANQLFARAILDELADCGRKPAVVWIQDYHLALCPKLVKEHRPSAIVSLFWHIPWPSYDVIRVCPQRKEIMEGLLGCDLLGFQTEAFVRNFLESVKTELSATVDFKEKTVIQGDHVTRVRAFPISIDYDWFDSLARSQETVKLMGRIISRHNLSGLKLGVGADRLDYTKGLIERLKGLDLFFARYPEYQGKFTFLQIAAPSRSKIRAYQRLRREVDQSVNSINEKYARNDWIPIRHIGVKLDQEDLAAYYRLADLGIVSSLHDGMNLVAKEYVACQLEGKGVLVLSELAGVFTQMKGCLPVNPFDTDGFAETIKLALEMPEKERIVRMRRLRRMVREHNLYKWMADIFTEIGHDLKA